MGPLALSSKHEDRCSLHSEPPDPGQPPVGGALRGLACTAPGEVPYTARLRFVASPLIKIFLIASVVVLLITAES